MQLSGPAARSLRAQLLTGLGFLTSAAVLVTGLTTVIVTSGALPRESLVALGILWLASTAVFVLFGAHLLGREVLDPLRRLADEADALAARPAAPRSAPGGPGDAGYAQRRPYQYGSRDLEDLSGRFHAMAGSLLDAQGHLVRVEKLAGIGQLAAGVAHEIRNPLGAIATYVEVLRGRGVEGEILTDLRTAVDRIERTVASLLAYAGGRGTGGGSDVPMVGAKRSFAPTMIPVGPPADPGAAARTALDFLEAQGAFRGRHLVATVAPDLSLVQCDRHALEQVIVNLALNARDASRGRVTVDVRAHRWDPGFRDAARGPAPDPREGEAQLRPHGGHTVGARRPAPATGGDGVLLVVADDGPGVPDHLRDRVFDPFFTTKDPGRGTGLGLAIVARTVHDAGGTVWVDRAREGGAAFKVFLPAIPAAVLACAS